MMFGDICKSLLLKNKTNTWTNVQTPTNQLSVKYEQLFEAVGDLMCKSSCLHAM